MPEAMTRDEARAIVAPLTFQMFPGKAVTHLEARALLGDERFDRLLRDPLRKWGPTPSSIYPWNVEDYLIHPELRKKPMSETIVCPSCNGEKQLVGMFPKYADHVPQEDRKPVVFFPCDRCGGEGRVPVIALKWIEQGKSLKAERMLSDVTLREFCMANNLDPLVRSKRERGIIDPSTPDVPYQWPTAAEV